MEDLDADVEVGGDCPNCGHLTYNRDCDNCEEGIVDDHDGDPINNSPGESVHSCSHCKGRGYFNWCPGCGWSIDGAVLV